ncbi:MAG: hypothetical protein HY662_04710 [Chloroflexi bacterium]|nr:hypothetical protein [Chloroflexota bacterium]
MRRWLSLGVALALVLTALSPTAVLAAKPAPFFATGIVTGMTPGNLIVPAGNSGNWRVGEREVSGIFLPVPGAAIAGPFAFTYDGVFDLATQSGNFHGTLAAGPNKFSVNGKVEPAGYAPDGSMLVKLTGHWTGHAGIKGVGTFEGVPFLIIDPVTGHVVGMTLAVTMTGSYQP